MAEGGEFTAPETVNVDQVHGNLSQEVVQITVDRLSLLLHKHADSLERKRSWVAPLGILFTIIVVFPSTDFSDKWLSAATWEAIFVLSAILVSTWLIRELIRCAKSAAIEDIVDKIKKG